MIADPPVGRPIVEGGDDDATLTWRGMPPDSEVTLEQSLLAALAFAAGQSPLSPPSCLQFIRDD